MKTLIASIALTLSFAAAPVMAAENPFSMGSTAQIQTASAADGKCGDSMKKDTGKCGDSKKAEDSKAMKEWMEKKTKEECAKEGKCGEGKCGGVVGFPETFVVGPDGRLAARVVGERDWDAPEMLKALEALARGEPATIR